MSERREGWYHVKIEGVWGCCEYDGFDWIVLNNSVEDKFFDEIGPRIPSPEEPWQCVPIGLTEEMITEAQKAGGEGRGHYTRALYLGINAAPSPDNHDA